MTAADLPHSGPGSGYAKPGHRADALVVRAEPLPHISGQQIGLAGLS
jgi:hypothetical protein